jgi:N-methylhydantoinase A/oxoprolinase/acetone carboxylase beta subunit
LQTLAATIQAAAVEAVAICLLHAYANGAHEIAARDALHRVLGAVPISVSHEVSPEMREYERSSTTCANAYLQPLVGDYLQRLQQRLAESGLRRPMLLILSSGSLTDVATAVRFPIRLLESGPAGGAIFACDIARQLNLDQVLSLDVGGTTAKFCMIDDGQTHQALQFEVARTYRFKKGSGLPVRVPVIDLVEIGAGGGSIVSVDAIGRVTVGPQSAGSEPGPACYGRGGTAATVTDSDLVLGKLDAAGFAGGRMMLDSAAALAAIDRSIGSATGMDGVTASYGRRSSGAPSLPLAGRHRCMPRGLPTSLASTPS